MSIIDTIEKIRASYDGLRVIRNDQHRVVLVAATKKAAEELKAAGAPTIHDLKDPNVSPELRERVEKMTERFNIDHHHFILPGFISPDLDRGAVHMALLGLDSLTERTDKLGMAMDQLATSMAR